MHNIINQDSFLVSDGEYDNTIICPVCGEHYVHFKSAFGRAGNDVNYEEWSGRGGCIRIPMYCENGHKWEMAVGHHKGKTYIFNTNKGPIEQSLVV